VIEFLRDNWVWFITLAGSFGLLGILIQLHGMSQVIKGSSESMFKRFGFAIASMAFAGLNAFALVASIVIQAIEHFQTAGAS